VCGTYFVHTGAASTPALFAENNTRDDKPTLQRTKKTLVVRFGRAELRHVALDVFSNRSNPMRRHQTALCGLVHVKW